MKKSLSRAFAFVFFVSLISYQKSAAQLCSGTISNGQNLVTNYDFTQAYSDWTHDAAYSEFTPCGSSCYSVPGRIYAGNNSLDFNQAFKMADGSRIPDHSPSGDNMMLMVDGICNLGVNLWAQSNIPLAANTNYYFSIWVTSLSNTTPSGTLRFNINGNALPTTISAPGVVGQWVKYTAVWNSGLTPPATATISIQNTTTTGCQTAVDFAVDDITFTPGCDFGTPGPSPDLGPDFTICGKTVPFNINAGLSAAAAARPDITYTWYKNGILQTTGLGPSFYNFSVNSAGTYSVCVDSAGSCPKSDIVTITNSYSIDLGPDVTLCSPVTTTLDAVYTGPGVTYQWFMNSNPIAGASGRTLTVTVAGNYSVTVTDPVCGVQSDAIVISSNAATPVNGTYCPSTGGVTSLSVTGTGKYKWWTAPTGGTVVATGPSYTTPALSAPGPHTFYVEDTSTFKLTLGPPAVGNGFTNVTNISSNDSKNLLVFNALTSFRLDSLTVLPYNYYCPDPSTGNANVINIIILDASGNTVGTSSYSAQCNGQGQPAPPLKVPVGINIPQGNGYKIKLNTGSSSIALYLNTTGSGGNPPSPELYHYPTIYNSASGPVAEFVANSAQDFNIYYSPNAIPGFFDWKITRGISCDRVPVSATLNCPTCTGSTVPTTVSVDNASYCTGTVSQITLSTTGGSGDNLVWYQGSCGGTQVGTNTTGADVTIAAPSSTTTYYARWESTGCNSACKSVTVTPVANPTASIAGNAQSFCNSTTATLAGNTPSVGTGQWTVVSGTGTVSTPSSATSGVTNIGPGDLVLQWTISNSPCPASSSQVTIHRDTLQTPAFSVNGAASDTCANTTGLVYRTTANHATATYNWSTTGTLNITAQTANTVTLDIGTSGGTLQLTESFGACNQMVSKNITISPNISAPNAGLDKSICADNVTLIASSPSVGTGVWTVTSGSGVIDNPGNSTTNVSSLGNGINTFTWTVNGCGGPLSDNVNVVVSASSLVIGLSGPTDTLCVGNSRLLQASVSGGSGQYTYYWSSKDNNLQNNPSPILSVNPTKPVSVYYVYASDNQNSGCNSNKDSVTIYSMLVQELIVPNLITPNGDNANDELLMRDVNMAKLLPNTEIEIVNRWGDIVYRNSNYDNTWKADGLSDGIYYYNLKTGCGAKVYKGWLQIIR